MRPNRFLRQIELAETRYYQRVEDRELRSQEICKMRDGLVECDLSQIDAPERIARRVMGLGLDPIVGETIISEAVSSGVDGRPVSVDLFERIISDNNLISSWFLNRGVACARTVGRIVIWSPSGSQLGFGTGFLVSPRLLLTNNHVLDTEALAAASTIQFDYVTTLGGQEVRINEFDLVPDQFFETDEELDFTLVAIEELNENEVLSSSRGWNRLAAESGKAIVGERVNIIQHPGGQRQQLGLRQNEIVDVVGSFMHYTTDTQKGSSGSPVFNDQWQVAALHHSGVPKRDPADHSKIYLIDGTLWNGSDSTVGQIAWIANEGVRISKIIEELEVRKSTMSASEVSLYEEVFLDPPATESNPSSYPVSNSQIPNFDEAGNATWTIPLRVSVGVGNSSVPSQAPHWDRQGKAKVAKQSSRKTKKSFRDSTDFDLAMRRMREHESQPYYDESADEQAVIDYYGDIDDSLIDEELFDALSHLVTKTHTTRLSYKTARLEHLYPWIDRRPASNADSELSLKSVYSGQGFSVEELVQRDIEIAQRHEAKMREFLRTESILDEDTIADFVLGLEATDPFNCEHVVPQSWFQKRQPMKADLHHLFTCESKCNSFRSNIPYYQFGPEEEVVRHHCGRREAEKFEPEAGKGAVARATMYFLLRYPQLTGDRNIELQSERLPVILDWHKQFPVDEYERHRNSEIAKAQGNRNPLIDFPDWAEHMSLELGFSPQT